MSALRDALRDLSEDVFFDLLESEDAYLLVLDLPGSTAESTDVTVSNGRVVIDARREKSVEDGYTYVTETRPVLLDVDLPLPADAVENGAEAAVERGVLELTLLKRSPRDETSIDVVDSENTG
jgi:HSP20 family protein